MTKAERGAPIDLARALDDPAATFGTPEAVVDHPDLDAAQKAEILRRWEYDAAEAAVAGEEGMCDDGNDLLQRILKSLHRVTGGFDVEHTAPSKQHGLPE